MIRVVETLFLQNFLYALNILYDLDRHLCIIWNIFVKWNELYTRDQVNEVTWGHPCNKFSFRDNYDKNMAFNINNTNYSLSWILYTSLVIQFIFNYIFKKLLKLKKRLTSRIYNATFLLNNQDVISHLHILLVHSSTQNLEMILVIDKREIRLRFWKFLGLSSLNFVLFCGACLPQRRRCWAGVPLVYTRGVLITWVSIVLGRILLSLQSVWYRITLLG